MNPATEQLLTAARTLPLDQQRVLADALNDAIDADEGSTPQLSEAWWQEIRRRSAELDAGTAETVSWQEVQVRWQAERASGG